MSSALWTTLAPLALRTAKRELKRARQKAQSRMECRTWQWEGRYAFEPIGENLWRIHLDPAAPLLLRHVPTRRCLVPAYREMDTDLASIPDFAVRIGRHLDAVHLERDSYVRSVVMHDALYTAGWCWVVVAGLASRATVTRAQADGILALGLACEGATVADCLTYHAGVRLGGASHWADARKATPQWPLLFGDPGAQP